MDTKNQIMVSVHTDRELLGNQGFSEKPAPHEDCMRTDGSENTYECWHADAMLEDGSTIMVVFCTKSVLDFDKPMSPVVQATYIMPDGKHYTFHNVFDIKDSFFATSGACDIRVGKNYFRGGLEKYEIHIDSEREDGLCFDLAITRTAESWRPGWDGLNLYGSEDAVLGWLIAVPQGRVDAKIKLNGVEKSLAGAAYHDHNWGNVGLPALFNHWYWARTETGPYTVICSHLVCLRAYDMVESGSFVLFKNGRVVTSRTGAAEEKHMLRSTPHVQAVTGKLLSNVIRFYHSDGGNIYELTLARDHNIFDADLTAPQFRAAAHAEGTDVGYHRLAGRAELRIFEKNCLKETHSSDNAIWEMMSFANPE